MPTDTLDIKSLNAALDAKRADANRIANAFKVDEKGRFEIPQDQYNDYMTVVNEAKSIKALVDGAKSIEQIGTYLDAPEGAPEAGRDAYTQYVGRGEAKTLGEMFVESKQFQAAKADGFEVPNFRTTIEGKTIYNYAAGTATVQGLGTPQQLPISELARRKMHIRDLFPKSSTSAPILYGVRETGWTNNAGQVRQRTASDGTSPASNPSTDKWGRVLKSKISLTTVTFPVAEVGHTLDAHKNILADESRLQTFINTRMVEGVKYAEDYDLLHSTGDGERITGLYNTPDVQQYTGLDTDGYSVQIRRAITKVMLAEYEPSGVVLSPTMWEAVEVEQDKQGQFRVAVSVAIGAEKRVWRLNVVETTAMDDTTFLLGAFGLGAALHDRESVSVRVSSENAQNFEDGLVTFRADERLALECVRPESFVIGSWTTPAA